MSETREHSFDGYISTADSGRGAYQLSGPQRCDNCERWRKKEDLGDFICKHWKGYKEAPARVKRCYDCDEWKKDMSTKRDFWCKHNKYRKCEWDREQGW